MNRLSLLRLTGCLLCAFAAAAGCSSDPADKTPPVPTADSIPTPKGSADSGAAGDAYRVKFETTKGDFVVEVHPEWAPRGAERFRELVEIGFYDDCRFFRVVKTFMVQFGINGDPEVMNKWRDAGIPDDRPTKSNQRGYITFATSGPDSRSTQVFINYTNNSFLDSKGFAPFGEVVEGMDVVDQLNGKYGEAPSEAQGQIQYGGNEFLDKAFPGLDSIKKATIVGSQPAAAPAQPE